MGGHQYSSSNYSRKTKSRPGPERGHPNTYRYAGASGRLFRLFVTDSAQADTGWTPWQRRAEWNHGTFPHTPSRYAVHNTTVADIDATVFQHYPNVPPHFELYCWLFSRLRRRTRCSKFFIRVSTNLQTPLECTPDLTTFSLLDLIVGPQGCLARGRVLEKDTWSLLQGRKRGHSRGQSVTWSEGGGDHSWPRLPSLDHLKSFLFPCSPA